jgi:hypothetical protein
MTRPHTNFVKSPVFFLGAAETYAARFGNLRSQYWHTVAISGSSPAQHGHFFIRHHPVAASHRGADYRLRKSNATRASRVSQAKFPRSMDHYGNFHVRPQLECTSAQAEVMVDGRLRSRGAFALGGSPTVEA